KRFYYSANIQAFISGTAPIQDGEYTSADYIMLHLRLTSGLNLTELKEKYGIIWGKEKQEFIAKLVANNLAVFTDNILRLTPQGMLIQNSILCELI
ncbi:MAG: coproporphyrinogen III oxidase family protein, partial [Oscillospiraceae bacterium]